ncbi:unnamed protein product [Coregonus sp. 'balchen']|nr:unnamed protein product [Coregonus sp. 'balchen']
MYGRFGCKHVTLWDLINSEYLCEDKRQELLKLYKSRMITIEEIIVIILEIIESKEIKWQAGLNFEGLRGNVSVVDLLRLETHKLPTGFIIDPLQNQKLTVDQALKQKVIGPELEGYKDPCADKKISLFQAMKKDLILQQHGIHLLEAQITTGGIIDPLRCLHLPLEVAYREGYFHAELNHNLTNLSDDTKGFFDPRTQANLTNMEMMEQCIKDPETGLFLLQLMDKAKTQEKPEKMYSDAEMKQEFENTTVSISVGCYSGKNVSLWDLIHSGYFTDDQRLQFLDKYRTKTITIQVIITLVIFTITKLEKN